VKFRFIQETEHLPQVGIFTLLEIPSGSKSDGLGSGQVQAFLPLWLQKSVGDWTVYGGGGYGINPGVGNENWGFGGVVVQRQVTKDVLIGAEVYHRTTMEIGGRADTAFNTSTVMDFTKHQTFASFRRTFLRRPDRLSGLYCLPNHLWPGILPFARQLVRPPMSFESSKRNERLLELARLFLKRGTTAFGADFLFGMQTLI